MGSVDRGGLSSCVDLTEDPGAWDTSPRHCARHSAPAVSWVGCGDLVRVPVL